MVVMVRQFLLPPSSLAHEKLHLYAAFKPLVFSPKLYT